MRRGAVIDQGGAVLATHDGVHGFTIGQRKGLGIAGPGPDGRPRYVTAIDADSGTVQVGSAADLEIWQLPVTGRFSPRAAHRPDRSNVRFRSVPTARPSTR